MSSKKHHAGKLTRAIPANAAAVSQNDTDAAHMRMGETAAFEMHLEPEWTDDELRLALPVPAADANKYSRGMLTVVAGSERYPGAACLATRAGQRMGAGYTEVVTTATAAQLILGANPSVVVRDAGRWSPDNLRVNDKGGLQAVCVGPGFEPGNAHAESLVLRVLKKSKCPVLVDGGGLAGLESSKVPKAIAVRRKHGLATVVTPHTGEAARLGRAFGVADDDPARLAAELAMATGAIVVLKGPDTFISTGNRIYAMREGTAALAKAGTGDVLAGMIASLLAQGVEPVAAAVLGATLHARAGIQAAQTYTDVAVTPEDIIEAIPQAIKTLLARPASQG